MVRCQSKRSLWAAAAAGVLILATGPAGLAQSLPADTSVSRSVAGQDAKMGAVLDSLKAAGLVQSNQRAAQAVKEDSQRAAQALKEASAQVQGPPQAPNQAPEPAPATETSIRSYVDALKAAGRLQESQRAAQAMKEAGAGMQGPSQAPGQSQGNGTSQTTQEALEAARVASQQALENARVSSEQILEKAREQAGMNELALKGAPPAFRDALERVGGFHSQTTADNASRGAASRGAGSSGAVTR